MSIIVLRAKSLSRVIRLVDKKHFYYILMLLSGLISFGKIGLYASLLTPTDLGAYSLCLLLSTYGVYICNLGLYEGALGTFPSWYGKKLNHKVESTRNQIIGFSILSGLCLCLISGILSLFTSVRILQEISIFLVCLFSSSTSLFVILLADIRSRLMTLRFGIFISSRVILSLLTGVLIAEKYGYIGILWSEIFITFLLTAILVHTEIVNFALAFPNFKGLRQVFRIGFPLMLNGAVTSTASNIDRFFVIAVLGSDIFGQYSFAMILASGGSMIQSILYQQIGPEILYKLGKGHSPRQVLSSLNKLIFGLSVLAIICAYPFLRFIQILVTQYFPEYNQVILILPIIYVGAIFTALSLYENLTVAVERTEYILAINASIILTVLLLSYFSFQYYQSLLTCAVIYSFGRFLYFMATLFMASWAVKQLSSSRQL